MVCYEFSQGVARELKSLVNKADHFITASDGLLKEFMDFFDCVAALKYDYTKFNKTMVSVCHHFAEKDY
eukprot:SAG11_NODE_16549_length_544_cov_1.125843_1_plen_68_part_10